MKYATSRSWSIYVVTKASNGVNIKKWVDTRQGYQESTIVTKQAIAQLSNERKQDLKINFKLSGMIILKTDVHKDLDVRIRNGHELKEGKCEN